MPFSAYVAVAPNANLPAGSRINIGVKGYFDKSFLIDKPGTITRFPFPPPIPAHSSLDIAVTVGDRPPMRLEARNLNDGSRATFFVLSGTNQERRFLVAGDVIAPKAPRASTAIPCECVCLNDNKTAGPGFCIDCENDDAIVRLCC
jgi:hypothetical protein